MCDPRGGRVHRPTHDAGMVTAELAVAVPALVVVLSLVLGAVGVGVDQVRCVDAARVAVRALARGDARAHAVGLAVGAAPRGAGVSSAGNGSEVVVTVAVRRTLPLVGWGFDLSATAAADREQRGDIGGGTP